MTLRVFIRRNGLLFASLPLLVLLFVRSEVSDPDALNHTVDAARRLRELDAVVSRELWKRKWRILPREELSHAADANRPWRNAPCESLLSVRLKRHPGWAC